MIACGNCMSILNQQLYRTHNEEQRPERWHITLAECEMSVTPARKQLNTVTLKSCATVYLHHWHRLLLQSLIRLYLSSEMKMKSAIFYFYITSFEIMMTASCRNYRCIKEESLVGVEIAHFLSRFLEIVENSVTANHFLLSSDNCSYTTNYTTLMQSSSITVPCYYISDTTFRLPLNSAAVFWRS